ncbi:MAG: heavy-metal-associated domain-containing protein [Actinobacteria bacterium]|nr:heavy-metal-associated domain-containing protein [Actinomycetota bacterium]
MERRTYAIESIHCEGCERAIRQVVGDLDGVSEVKPDARSNTTEVVFDPNVVSENDVISAFGDAGFPVMTADAHDDGRGSRGAGRYALLAVGVLAVALAGYLGYVLYPRFDLPAVEGVAVLGLAAAAGVASFFSPCSFPLLLAILGRQAAARSDGEGTSAAPLVFGGALAAGAGTFLLIAGLVIAAGGGTLFAQVTFASTAGITIRAVVGVVLVLLGLVQLGVLPSPFHAVEERVRPLLRRQAQLRRERPVVGFAAFGFGYVLAGFG